MNHFTIRRARVRPEFARLYPEIVPGVWMSAKLATRLVRRRGRSELCRQHGCDQGRVLCDAHFEFRGGQGRRHDRNDVLIPRAAFLAACATGGSGEPSKP
jgi:hypothetical protein